MFFRCPLCSEQWYDGDKRFKKSTNVTPIRIYRASETSITLQCKRCGLKYMVTWRNFQKAFEKYAELYPEHTFAGSNDNFYKTWAEALNLAVDAKYSTRKPPSH